jgi:hypothetical protein
MLVLDMLHTSEPTLLIETTPIHILAEVEKKGNC